MGMNRRSTTCPVRFAASDRCPLIRLGLRRSTVTMIESPGSSTGLESHSEQSSRAVCRSGSRVGSCSQSRIKAFWSGSELRSRVLLGLGLGSRLGPNLIHAPCARAVVGKGDEVVGVVNFVVQHPCQLAQVQGSVPFGLRVILGSDTRHGAVVCVVVPGRRVFETQGVHAAWREHDSVCWSSFRSWRA